MAGLYGNPQKKVKDKVKSQGGLCKKVGRVEVCDAPTKDPDSFVKSDKYVAPSQKPGRSITTYELDAMERRKRK